MRIYHQYLCKDQINLIHHFGLNVNGFIKCNLNLMTSYIPFVHTGISNKEKKRVIICFSFFLIIENNTRSNMHGRKRPYTAKYDDLHVIVLRP